MSLAAYQSDRRLEDASFDALLSSILDPLVLLDCAGNIVASNQAWTDAAKTLGATPGRIGLGVNYVGVCQAAIQTGDASALHALEGIESVLHGRSKLFRMQYACEGTRGHVRWYHMRVSRLSGAMEGALIIHEDITDAKLRIATLHEEIHHLNRIATLGQLAASVTHQIRQPLTAIMCNAQTAIDICDHDATVRSDVRELLHDIVEADRVATTVINDFRNFLKRAPALRIRVDLQHDVVTPLLGILRPTLMQSNIFLHYQTEDSTVVVMGDRSELLHAILNLAVNAVEAVQTSEGQRRIDLVIARVPRQSVCVRVSNNGPQIPRAQLERIFDPFVSTKPDGLGLGLAICRELVQENNGHIWATSNPQETSFNVVLPCINES